ncbi:K(+)/H(+) antiporter 1 [Termitomyces sp. J132]|nr:hypothetical protein H2248_007968 [Termitomyces sp. 'cryptogamus']KNZ73922.1 K(+)/H(+) antiporter 1 [Termitomyces sp. J132]
MEHALAYHEPSIATILLQSSFLISSNVVCHILDWFFACGIVGQIFIGILFGEPSGLSLGLLLPEFQQAVVSLGYIGLILLCFQGGTHSSLADLWVNKHLSFVIALTGILLPIALSFLLMPLINNTTATSSDKMTALQAFAAGAALSATSLGTSFSIISVAGLQQEKVGIILSSAAMMDDVVGLVLIAITKVLSLSGGGGDQQSIGATVARPIVASFGSVIVLTLILWMLQYSLPALSRLVVKGCIKCMTNTISRLWRWNTAEMSLFLHLLLLFTIVAASTYAGTSLLFMAFLSGIAIAWLTEKHSLSFNKIDHNLVGKTVHSRYLQQIQDYLLLPFFFASIGFAIPSKTCSPLMWSGRDWFTLYSWPLQNS